MKHDDTDHDAVLDAVRTLEPLDLGARMSIAADHTASRREELLAQGLWWIVPLVELPVWRRAGLALLPDREGVSTPVVLSKYNVAVTIAARPSHALPTLLVHAGLGWSPDVASHARNHWSALVPGLSAWHEALSGQPPGDEFLEVLRDFVESEPTRDETSPGLLALEERLGHRSFRANLAQLVETHDESALDAPVDPAWDARIHLYRYLWRQMHRASPEAIRAAAWELQLGAASLDTCQSSMIETKELAGLFLPVAACSETSLIEAATELCPRPACEDPLRIAHPLWPAIPTLADSHAGYTGDLHLDAAMKLGDMGEYATAYKALMSASFWASLHGQQSTETLAAHARELAQEAGWQTIVEHLDELLSPHG